MTRRPWELFSMVKRLKDRCFYRWQNHPRLIGWTWPASCAWQLALSATLYELIMGTPPPRVMQLDRVPLALRAVLVKALEELPEDRYQTATELRDALRQTQSTLLGPRAAVAKTVAAGHCPGCEHQNDPAHEFCESCGGSLRERCLNCGQSVGVWVRCCTKCGKDRGAPRAAAAESEQRKQQIESDWRAYQYKEAISSLEELAELEDHRLQEYANWRRRNCPRFVRTWSLGRRNGSVFTARRSGPMR